jgi:hypothetical protein
MTPMPTVPIIFNFESLINTTDLLDPALMKAHRDSMDAGALLHHPGAIFVKEEIDHYILSSRKPGQLLPKDQAESTSTLRFRVLRRFYV